MKTFINSLKASIGQKLDASQAKNISLKRVHIDNIPFNVFSTFDGNYKMCPYLNGHFLIAPDTLFKLAVFPEGALPILEGSSEEEQAAYAKINKEELQQKQREAYQMAARQGEAFIAQNKFDVPNILGRAAKALNEKGFHAHPIPLHRPSAKESLYGNHLGVLDRLKQSGPKMMLAVQPRNCGKYLPLKITFFDAVDEACALLRSSLQATPPDARSRTKQEQKNLAPPIIENGYVTISTEANLRSRYQRNTTLNSTER